MPLDQIGIESLGPACAVQMPLDWSSRVSEIQELYFRSGKGTYLWIVCDQANGNVSWGYHMLDLGMCHALSGSSRVEEIDLDGPCYLVNGRVVGRDERAVWGAVFGGHYERFLAEIREDLGIPLTPHPSKL